MPTTSRVIVKESPEACAKYVEEQLVQIIAGSIESRGKAVIVLAGGSTPKLLYESLARLPSGTIDWPKVILLWGDERNVPPDHNDSNYRMVKQALLDQLVPDQSPTVYRIPTGDLKACDAATAYEHTLKELSKGDEPLFDVVLLGIGDDAHTASLFPETQALYCHDRLVVENWVEKFETWRVTLTYSALNTARQVYFLVCGSSKTPALKNIWSSQKNIENYPAQGVAPKNGAVEWVIDSSAAAGIETL